MFVNSFPFCGSDLPHPTIYSSGETDSTFASFSYVSSSRVKRSSQLFSGGLVVGDSLFSSNPTQGSSFNGGVIGN